MNAPLKLVVIGSGNVATHLATALERAGSARVVAVWSRTLEHAAELGHKLAEPFITDDLTALPVDADMYLVSVADDAIADIAARMTPNGKLWAHTSGTVDTAVLSRLTDSYGVFYPLQTFSKNVAVDVSEAPFFIEGSNPATLRQLKELAATISRRVYEADSAVRGKLHAAAVFACNFANHLWAIADDILHRSAGADITILEPLLRETLRKALTTPPALGQTGPARRGDKNVMARHEALLNDHEREIYRMLSQSILDYYSNEFNKL